ncbi:conserved exported hypothetical protein [metagenome]|uniref:Uncharacterized protein n=1 Tax=metagenome TaxID=256318 RepID=A0A2P2C0A8_9ZZZZ
MSLFRSQRRPAALTAGVLLLAAPLSACGFGYSTDSIYVSSAGVDYREGPLDVLSAVVVSAEPGSGTFIASFSNNDGGGSEQVLALTPGTDPVVPELSGFTPFTVAPSALVNLADPDPVTSVAVSGDFIAGQYVSITLDLENADDIEMSVPVVAATDQYEGLDVSGEVSPAATPSDDASPTE